MARVFGSMSRGGVSVEALDEPFSTGETIRVVIADCNNYLTRDEAIALQAALGRAIAATPLLRVEVKP